jgi:hypothetical protein
MIKCAADIAKAYDEGGVHLQPFYKVWASTFNTANAWWDATLSGNFPRASYYSADDLVFAPYPDLNHLSFFHGGNVSPNQKILRTIHMTASSANLAPSRYILCDYLGFAGGISWETSELQEIDNSLFSIPRYTDGKGVRAIMVQLFGSNANAIYTINYRDCLDNDVDTPTQTANSLGTGALQHANTNANYSPFMNMPAGCTGIKRVNSVTVSSLGAGVAVLILVKPIAEISFKDSTLFAPAEVDFLTDKLEAPIIYDGAKLNFLFTSTANPAATLTRGYLEFIWT